MTDAPDELTDLDDDGSLGFVPPRECLCFSLSSRSELVGIARYESCLDVASMKKNCKHPNPKDLSCVARTDIHTRISILVAGSALNT